MRRFIAYLSLAFAGLVTIAATFNSVFTKAKSNIEYADGRALTFRLSSNDEGIDEMPEDGSGAKEIAEIMQERLKTYGVTRYDVITEGNDTVKAIVSESQDTKYEQIKTYLSFNGAFALGTADGSAVAVGDEFIDTNNPAYVTFVNSYPTVVIPVNYESEQFKAVIEKAENKEEPGKGMRRAEGDGNEGEEGEDTDTYIYLAYNFVEGEDSISQMIEGNEDYDADKAEKILMRFGITNIWFNDEHTAISNSINIDADGDGSVTSNDVSNGTQTAKYYVNLLNADALPYDVEFIFESHVNAYFENVIYTGMRQTINFSRLFIAFLMALIIISAILAVLYHWSAISVGIISLGSTYLAAVLSFAFSIEFSIATVIGLILVAIGSLVSGAIYLTKLKEECYRGRTLKKANSEAAKKSLLPIVDINVILIIVGAVSYWLGGVNLVPFAAAAVFGGLASLILNTLGLRGMMWLLTNTTAFAGKYEKVVAVKEDKVPNLMNEEKQTYFGPFQDRDFTKKSKIVGIISSVLLVAGVAGSIVFGVLNNGAIFSRGNYTQDNTYLYIETTTKHSYFSVASVTDLLGRTYVVNDGSDKLISYANVEDYTRSETKDEVTTEYTYIVTTFNENYNGKEEAYIVDASDSTVKVASGSLNELFTSYVETLDADTNASASLKVGSKLANETPDMSSIMIASAVSVGFVALYLILRYGISRGLASVCMTALVGGITVGLIALLRFITAGNEILLSLPLLVAFSAILATIFFDKDKELKKEDFARNKDNSVEKRNEIMVRAQSLANGPIVVAILIAAYIFVDFFGFDVAAATKIYGFGLIGVLLSGILSMLLVGPISQLFFKLFKKINIKKPNLKKVKKVKKKKANKSNSSEPEEAIFIGIND